MNFYTFKELPQEYVTPKYSKAYGGLLQGEHIEVGWLSFGADEGAVEHAHPHEQIMVVVSGRLRVRFGEEIGEIGPGQAFLAPPNVPHQVTAIEDTEVISCKNTISGVGHKI
ncbi:MAG: cupin domain-containing protein [Anaerolineae bacterium]|jgi:quercetin dioxygenase-like cupin family protein